MVGDIKDIGPLNSARLLLSTIERQRNARPLGELARYGQNLRLIVQRHLDDAENLRGGASTPGEWDALVDQWWAMWRGALAKWPGQVAPGIVDVRQPTVRTEIVEPVQRFAASAVNGFVFVLALGVFFAWASQPAPQGAPDGSR